MTTDFPEYLALLRECFDKRLENRLRHTFQEAFREFAKDRDMMPDLNQIGSRMSDKAARDLVMAEMKTFQTHEGATQGRAGKSQVKEFYETSVLRVFDEFDALFDQVLAQGESLFLYVGHLCNLLKDYGLGFGDVSQLPKGEGLYLHYLTELEKVLADKQWETLKQVILVLTAAEEADAKDLEIMEITRKAGEEWPGVPLDVLTSLLNEPQKRSARLVFSLYTLKEILKVDKTGARESRYRLGLKDFAGAVREQWRDDLIHVHERQAREFHQAWQARYRELDDDEPGGIYGLRYLLAYAELSGNSALQERVWGDKDLADAMNYGQGKRAYDRAYYKASGEWFTCALQIYKRQWEETHEHALQNDLAAAYVNRGNALQGQGDLSGAVRDYGVAIGLGEELKAWHETEGLEFPSGWQNDLAAAYMNRGNALQGQGDLSGAVRDYGVAIGLGEELLFARQFAPVIPDLAKAFYNVILLIRKDDLPPDIRPEEWQTRVETFLNRLGQLTDIEQLPGHWRKEVEDLRGLLDRPEPYKRDSGGFLRRFKGFMRRILKK